MRNRSITITLDEDDREVVRVRLNPKKHPEILIHKNYLSEKHPEECTHLLRDVQRWIDLLVDNDVGWINLSYR